MPVTTTNPMPSPHAEGAKALLEKIRALRAEIPRLLVPATGDDPRNFKGPSGVPDAFMESASVAVQTWPRLEQAAGIDASTLRDAFGFAISYDAVVNELRALTRMVAHSLRVQRAEAAASALDVYAIARRMSKRKDGAELRPHVEDMGKKLTRNRVRRTKSEPAPAPPAAPTAPSPKV